MITSLPVDALARLIADAPELADALRDATGAEAAADTLLRAAQANGIPVDREAAAAFFAQRMAAPDARLSDGDLDAVAGGTHPVSIILDGGCANLTKSRPGQTCSPIR